MQVFITGTAFETAQVLDKKRLNKQIVECNQILSAIKGETKAWNNHPCTNQYRDHVEWLENYVSCLYEYKSGNIQQAKMFSAQADIFFRPEFHTEEYFNQMKRRLYTKDPVHYAQWSDLGTSEENWYWLKHGKKFIKYVDGKRL